MYLKIVPLRVKSCNFGNFFMRAGSLDYQPMLLHLYIKLGSCPRRWIYPEGQLPTTQIFVTWLPLPDAPDDECDGRHHCQLSALPNWVLVTVGCLMRKFSVHPIPRVRIVPSGMFRTRQGERDRVQSKNPAVAGLQDPRTPPERPCCNRAPSALAPCAMSAALCMLPSSLHSIVYYYNYISNL